MAYFLYTPLFAEAESGCFFPQSFVLPLLLADGFITPPISISAAVEGLRVYNPDVPTVAIVITILVFLFGIQQFGTAMVGRAFGPIMFIWFSMLGVLGFIQIIHQPPCFLRIESHVCI